MKILSYSFVFFLYSLISAAVSYLRNGDPTIIQVSTSVDKYVYPRCSKQGGTILYIKGTNFSPLGYQNIVLIGPYPCILEGDVAQDNKIVCRTTKIAFQVPYQIFEVRVIVNGIQATCVTSKCSFRYSQSWTPELNEVFPRSAISGQLISMAGYHIISQIGDGRSTFDTEITNFIIQDRQCTTLDIEQSQFYDAFDGNSWLQCRVDPTQVAGEYEVLQQVKQGYSRVSARSNQTSYFTGKNYTQRILANITQLSAKQSGSKGRVLKLKGTGFSPNPSDYNCQIGTQTCYVTQVNEFLNEITVEIAPLQNLSSDFGKLLKDPLDSTTQKYGFLGGQGARYRKYNISEYSINRKTIREWYLYIKANTSLRVVEQKIITQLSSPTCYDFHYLEYVEGYFRAPVSGLYNFTVISNYQFIMYMSTKRNNGNPLNNAQFLYNFNSVDYSRFVPFIHDTIDNLNQVYLEEGYYYFEALSVNYPDDYGFFKVSADFPSQRLDFANKAWKTERVFIKPNKITPQIIILQVYATSGNYTLWYYDQLGKFISSKLPFNATAAQFSNLLSPIKIISRFNCRVTRLSLAADGTYTTDPILTAGYEYNISVGLYRKNITLPSINVSELSSISSVPVSTAIYQSSPHSLPINGTITIMLNTSTILYNVPYNSDLPDIILQELQNHFNNMNIYCSQFINMISVQNQMQLIIEYVGVYQDPGNLIIDTSNLTGGATGQLLVQITPLRQNLNREVFMPIPYDFLYLPSDNPFLNITINSLPAVCFDCTFTYNIIATPQILSAHRVNEILTIVLNNPSSINYQLLNISVTFQKLPCKILSGTPYNFGCSLPVNADGSAMVTAGNATVRVHIQQIGFADSSLLTPEIININVVSAFPSSCSSGGGINVTIIGSGFPLSLDQNFHILVCGNQVTEFTQISNQKVVFIVPPKVIDCTNSNSIVSYGGQNTSFILLYSDSMAPTILSLSKSSLNPIMQTSLIISGSNFGLLAQTKVFLMQNKTKKYELKIQYITPNSINCSLKGGKTGDYDVVVEDARQGASTPNQNSRFSYKLVITNLSMSLGNKGGGYIITVTGYNFASTVLSTNVTIGLNKTSICHILTINETQINCKVPRMIESYTVGVALDVYVWSRAEKSLCEGSCTFQYVENGTSTITLPSNVTYLFNQTVTLQGSGLAGATVRINNILIPPIFLNNSYLQFLYPALEAGYYEVEIQTLTGNTYPKFVSFTPLSILTNGTLLSSFQGSEGNIYGNGFSTVSQVWAAISCFGKYSKITTLSVSPSNAILRFPKPTNYPYCLLYVFAQTKQYKVKKTLSLESYWSRTCSISLTGTGLTYTYTFTLNNMTSSFAARKAYLILLDSDGNQTQNRIQMNITGNSIWANYLACGSYSVKIHDPKYGFAIVNPSIINVSFASIPSFNGIITSSFFGGKTFNISGSGFIVEKPSLNQILICGQKAEIISADSSSISIKIPPLITQQSQYLYQIASKKQLTGKPLVDNNTLCSNCAFDNSLNTFYSSKNTICYVGLDFGAGTVAQITQIKFIPNQLWVSDASLALNGGLFQGSNDGVIYTTIFEIDTTLVHSNWNYWKSTTAVPKYQYFRFRHDVNSGCQMAQIKLYGIKYSTQTVIPGSDKACDVQIKRGNIIMNNVISYSHSQTATINQIQPRYGFVTGGDLLQIRGSNFGLSLQILIDGISCMILNSTSSQIYCITGARNNSPASENTFLVTSDDNNVQINCFAFIYIEKWSMIQTWSGQSIPREGDPVLIPKGKSVIVDQNTPILGRVTVEGTIIFEDKDLSFDCQSLIINGGVIEAGTQQSPFQHNLIITLHGKLEDEQIPMFGNKALGCFNCKFNINGKPRKTWTQIRATIQKDQSQFSVIEPVDWIPGDKIAIASTSLNHYESEQKTISYVSLDGLTVSVTTPFQYRHYGGVQIYGSSSFSMRAEVGLLNRNIMIKGSDDSSIREYGSHLIFTGKQQNGLLVRMSYVQFTKCGQTKIIGRYCTHFYMTGQVPSSFVKGISVHHAFGRVLALHGTHFLIVQKNIGYRVKGHNIILVDGSQVNNTIQDNLMISTISTARIFESDVSPASYRITNPYNIVQRNHAAGGDYFGFWYEFKDRPAGPNSARDFCPMGMRVGISQDNVAHSIKRFGLHIYKFSARKYPCIATLNNYLADPYLANIAIQSVFDNYSLWKNGESGFLGEQLGFTTIKNFKLADNIKAGLQFHKTNYTKENVTAQNCLIVGISFGNPSSNISFDYLNTRGLITSRTDGLRVISTSFYNFMSYMTPIKSCSQCDNQFFWVTGGKTTFFYNISYINIQGQYIYWENWRRQIFIDQDGSLSAPLRQHLGLFTMSPSSLSPYRPSLKAQSCRKDTSNLWGNTIYCGATNTMRSIMFSSFYPFSLFQYSTMSIILLSSASEDISTRILADFSRQPSILIKRSMDRPYSWAIPFANGQIYNVHWGSGLTWKNMTIYPSRLWLPEEGVVLRFNYSNNLTIYTLQRWLYNTSQLSIIPASLSMINPSTCENGQYYHDWINKYLFVCISGRNKSLVESIQINSTLCVQGFNCPSETILSRQPFNRVWSNITQWPNQILPGQNENVVIPYEWNLFLDMDPPVLNYVEINGILHFNSSRDNTFQAHYIWVKQGIIKIGSRSLPFSKKANIILHGSINSCNLVLDQQAIGNKILAVTGGLQFFGIQPQTVWTRLIETTVPNSTSIKVSEAGGWKIGDKIVIGPSYSSQIQFEEVTITEINSTIISFFPALTYGHYGAPAVTLNNSYGILDTRTAVGLLSRNIKISAASPSQWGCRVLIYGQNQSTPDQNRTYWVDWKDGYAKMRGVEIQGCGQFNTSLAALRIQNVGRYQSSSAQTATQIETISIHNCVGICIYLKQISNIHIKNNVFFNAKKYIVYAQQILANYTFSNNLMIGVRKNRWGLQQNEVLMQSYSYVIQDVAAYQQYYPIFLKNNSHVSIINNVVQGSQGKGFVLPATKCNLINFYPYVNNTAGSCQTGFVYNGQYDEASCLAVKGARVYASILGVNANMAGILNRVQYSDFILADNSVGISLRFSNQYDDNTLIFKDSYISGISRPTCTDCYGISSNSFCNGSSAVRMLVVTAQGDKFPLAKGGFNFNIDSINSKHSFDGKAFLNNITFENYLNQNQLLPYCSNMRVFKRHFDAADATCSHYLKNTRCINCQISSWAFFDQPLQMWKQNQLCGDLDCTGPNNYLIYDQDGNFTGYVSQILANNSIVGTSERTCTFISSINGHWCISNKFAIMQYDSITPNRKNYKYGPISLKYNGGLWTSITNSWMQREISSDKSFTKQNFPRFWSIIKLNESYDLNFASKIPLDLRFQIQNQSLVKQNVTNWVIIKMMCPFPCSIQILVKNQTGRDYVQKPLTKTNNELGNISLNKICGTNIFDPEQGSIQFMLGGSEKCQVRVRQSSFIQWKAKIIMTLQDFIYQNLTAILINNVCDFLGISRKRMKIMLVREQNQNLFIESAIHTQAIDINISPITNLNPAAEYIELNGLKLRLQMGLNQQMIGLPSRLVESALKIYIMEYEQQEKQYNLQNIVLMAVISAMIVMAVLIAMLYSYRTQANSVVAKWEGKSDKTALLRTSGARDRKKTGFEDFERSFKKIINGLSQRVPKSVLKMNDENIRNMKF